MVLKLKDIQRITLTLTFTFVLLANNLFNKKTLFVIFIIQIFLNRSNTRELTRLIIKNKWMFFLLFYCLLSYFWSSKQNLVVSAFTTQFLLVLTCALVVAKTSNNFILVCASRAAILVLFFNFVILILNPGSVSGDGFPGLYHHNNSAGLAIAICAFIILGSNQRNIIKFPMIALSVVLLILTKSKTSIGFFFFSVSVYWGVCFYKNNYFLKKAGIVGNYLAVLVLVFTIVLLIVFKSQVLDWIYYNVDRQMLTGRGEIWVTMLTFLEDYLILGYGYNSVWSKDDSIIYLTDLYLSAPLWVEKLAASDSGYVDLILSIGVVGTGVLMLGVIKVWGYLMKVEDPRQLFFLVCIIVFTVLHNITETTFLFSTNMLWVMFVLSGFMSISESKAYVNKY